MSSAIIFSLLAPIFFFFLFDGFAIDWAGFGKIIPGRPAPSHDRCSPLPVRGMHARKTFGKTQEAEIGRGRGTGGGSRRLRRRRGGSRRWWWGGGRAAAKSSKFPLAKDLSEIHFSTLVSRSFSAGNELFHETMETMREESPFVNGNFPFFLPERRKFPPDLETGRANPPPPDRLGWGDPPPPDSHCLSNGKIFTTGSRESKPNSYDFPTSDSVGVCGGGRGGRVSPRRTKKIPSVAL